MRNFLICSLFLLSAVCIASPALQAKQNDNDDDKTYGIVKWFKVNKGFGFITAENDQTIFVYYKDFNSDSEWSVRNLDEGDCVSFDIARDDNGSIRAVDVEYGRSSSRCMDLR